MTSELCSRAGSSNKATNLEEFIFLGQSGWRIEWPQAGSASDLILKRVAKFTSTFQPIAKHN